MATSASTQRNRESLKTRRAAAEKEHAAAKQKRASRRKHWWERLLVYPTLIGALITAGPLWVDKVQAWRQNVASGSLRFAQEQNALWHANFDCSTLPAAWYTGVGNVKVDTTTCNSGDVFIRAMTPDSHQGFLWVPLSAVFKSAGGNGEGLIGAAYAATLPAQAPLHAALALQEVKVLCQKFIDDRHIRRRVQTPQGCFDEIIDTYNNQVVSRTAAPCTCS